jgi:hypothetical protein
VKEVAKRVDIPLGDMRRKVERQRAERARMDKGARDRIVDAFDQLSRSRARKHRTWVGALFSDRAPFPRR